MFLPPVGNKDPWKATGGLRILPRGVSGSGIGQAASGSVWGQRGPAGTDEDPDVREGFDSPGGHHGNAAVAHHIHQGELQKSAMCLYYIIV